METAWKQRPIVNTPSSPYVQYSSGSWIIIVFINTYYTFINHLRVHEN